MLNYQRVHHQKSEFLWFPVEYWARDVTNSSQLFSLTGGFKLSAAIPRRFHVCFKSKSQMGLSINGGTPIAGWFISFLQSIYKMDDLG
jgi:hypothetical protein